MPIFDKKTQQLSVLIVYKSIVNKNTIKWHILKNGKTLDKQNKKTHGYFH